MAASFDIGQLRAFAYESITVSSTALGFTAATIKPTTGGGGAIYAYGTVETDAIRFRVDGLNPAADEGHKVSANSAFEVFGESEVSRFRMIRVTNDATVKVTYYRRQ